LGTLLVGVPNKRRVMKYRFKWDRASTATYDLMIPEPDNWGRQIYNKIDPSYPNRLHYVVLYKVDLEEVEDDQPL